MYWSQPSVCLSFPRHILTVLYGPGGNLVGMPSSCALLGGFGIGALSAKYQRVLVLTVCLV